ncbi:MAG: stage III sporulation AC/AD family protein, partial [Defluviitaleaceae bacterium]|nr:stage III sporulation AC/AD family protein [Defluviitaleaceae bacterium]
MDIFQIVAIGIVGGILAVMLKKDNPTFAVMISLAVAVLIFILLMPPLAGLIALISNITGWMSSGQEYVLVVV